MTLPRHRHPSPLASSRPDNSGRKQRMPKICNTTICSGAGLRGANGDTHPRRIYQPRWPCRSCYPRRARRARIPQSGPKTTSNFLSPVSYNGVRKAQVIPMSTDLTNSHRLQGSGPIDSSTNWPQNYQCSAKWVRSPALGAPLFCMEFTNTMSHDKHKESQQVGFRLLPFVYAILRILRVIPPPSQFPLFNPVQFVPKKPQLNAAGTCLSHWRMLNPQTSPTRLRKTRGQHDQVDQHDQPQIGLGSLGG